MVRESKKGQSNVLVACTLSSIHTNIIERMKIVVKRVLCGKANCETHKTTDNWEGIADTYSKNKANRNQNARIEKNRNRTLSRCKVLCVKRHQSGLCVSVCMAIDVDCGCQKLTDWLDTQTQTPRKSIRNWKAYVGVSISFVLHSSVNQGRGPHTVACPARCAVILFFNGWP